MGEICEYFELKSGQKSTHINSQKVTTNYDQKLKSLEGLTIMEAAGRFEMTVTDFLRYLGEMEKEGKIKIRIV